MAMMGEISAMTKTDKIPRIVILAKTMLLRENLVAASSSVILYLFDLFVSKIPKAALKGISAATAVTVDSFPENAPMNATTIMSIEIIHTSLPI